jgi:hypothetical protein
MKDAPNQEVEEYGIVRRAALESAECNLPDKGKIAREDEKMK